MRRQLLAGLVATGIVAIASSAPVLAIGSDRASVAPICGEATVRNVRAGGELPTLPTAAASRICPTTTETPTTPVPTTEPPTTTTEAPTTTVTPTTFPTTTWLPTTTIWLPTTTIWLPTTTIWLPPIP